MRIAPKLNEFQSVCNWKDLEHQNVEALKPHPISTSMPATTHDPKSRVGLAHENGERLENEAKIFDKLA